MSDHALLTDEAYAAASRAAARSRVTVRSLDDLDELAQLIDLFDRIWSNDGPPPIGLEHLRALAHTGNYVTGAFDVDGGSLLGGTIAFFAAPVGTVLHSDITGVDVSARDRRLGFALKLHQRAWCLDLGIQRVTWTFDPLIARNAYFNLVKLRAVATHYHVDFYGPMDDGINANQGSDRLLACWDLASADVAGACAGRQPVVDRALASAPCLLAATDAGPAAQVVDAGDGLVRIEVPRDIEALRRSDPDAARTWRKALRDTLGAELMAGAHLTGFDPRLGYAVARPQQPPGGLP